MLGDLKRFYERFEPIFALFGTIASVYAVFATAYADFAGVDPLLLSAAMTRLIYPEYSIPLALICLGILISIFGVWARRGISMRWAFVLVAMACASLLMFRVYVFGTIGPKVKSNLFAQIAQASCGGDYPRAIGLVDQILASRRLARFERDAKTYQDYLKALEAIKRYRNSLPNEARSGFELAGDQILFGTKMSRDYKGKYFRGLQERHSPPSCSGERT